jgi:hypothetical protein
LLWRLPGTLSVYPVNESLDAVFSAGELKFANIVRNVNGKGQGMVSVQQNMVSGFFVEFYGCGREWQA